MARFTVKNAPNMVLTFTTSSQGNIRTLRDLQRKLWLQVHYGNEDAEIIRLMNLIPTIASEFKGAVGTVGEFASMLGDYAEEAAAAQKTSILNGINEGYYFFDGLTWDSRYISMKVEVPTKQLVDSQNNYKHIRYISGTGWIISKTNSDGITITF